MVNYVVGVDCAKNDGNFNKVISDCSKYESPTLMLMNLGCKAISEIKAMLSKIPNNVQWLAMTGLDKKTSQELAQILSSIPTSISSLNLTESNFGNQSVSYLKEVLAAIPLNISMLCLGENGLGSGKNSSELIEIFTAIPSHVKKVNLRNNNLDNINNDNLIRILAAIPYHVTSLDLSGNFSNKKGEDLAKIFGAIPSHVKTLRLGTDFYQKTNKELVKVFSAIPSHIKVDSDNPEILKKYNINFILDSYIEKRKEVKDFSGKTKEYFYGGFFSNFQKSFNEKNEAIKALKSALNGNSVDLSSHLSTLRNGNLGRELRTFIKRGMGTALVGKEVNTVTEFVMALSEKNTALLQSKITSEFKLN